MNRQITIAKAIGAAGLMTEESTRWQTNILYSRLLHDPVVNERCVALGNLGDTAELAYGDEDVVKIIQQMTPAEKQALRERIAGR